MNMSMINTFDKQEVNSKLNDILDTILNSEDRSKQIHSRTVLCFWAAHSGIFLLNVSAAFKQLNIDIYLCSCNCNNSDITCVPTLQGKDEFCG